MIKLAVGFVFGIAVMTTFPAQTVQLSTVAKGLINKAAGVVVEQTKEQSTVDKLLN